MLVGLIRGGDPRNLIKKTTPSLHAGDEWHLSCKAVVKTQPAYVTGMGRKQQEGRIVIFFWLANNLHSVFWTQNTDKCRWCGKQKKSQFFYTKIAGSSRYI